MIGDVLKTLREKKGATQDQMANLLCVKRQTYSAYERNVSVPDANTIKTLSEFFEVSADVLLGVDKKKTALDGQPLTESQLKLASLFTGLNDEELERITYFVEFVKTKRNP